MMKIKLLALMCLIAGGSLMSQSHPVFFDKMTGTDYDYESNDLFKPQSDSWTDGVAFSSNVVSTESSPKVSYVIQNSGDTKAFGWADAYDPSSGLASLDYAFYIDRGMIFITTNGAVKGRFGRSTNGVALDIRFKNGRVEFLMNGRAIMSKTAPNPSGYAVGAVIYNQGGNFSGLTSTIDHEYYVKETIADITSTSDGSLSIMSEGKQTGSDEFYWGDDYMTLNEFNSEISDLDQEFLALLGADPYATVFQTNQTAISASEARVLTVHYPVNGQMESKTMRLSYPLEVTYNSNALLDNRVVTASARNASLEFDSYYFTDDNGWISFQVGAKSENTTLGLFDKDDPTGNFEVKYGWTLKSGDARYLDNGVPQSTNKGFVPTDEFTIELNNGSVEYYKNGMLEGTVIMDHSIDVLQLKADLEDAGSYLKKLGHSKPPAVITGCAPKISVDHFECDGSGQASITVSFKTVNPLHCGGPFDFYWSSSRGDISYQPQQNVFVSEINPTYPGTYHVSIQDGNTILQEYDIDVGFKHDWVESGQATSADFDLIDYNNLLYGGVPSGGESSSKLKQTVDGWIEFQLDQGSFPGQTHSAQVALAENETTSLGEVWALQVGSFNLNSLILNGVSQNNDLDLTDAHSIKIKRTDGENYIMINHQEILLSDNINVNSSLVGLARLGKMDIVETHSSFSCAKPQYANLTYDQDGALYHTTGGKFYFKYVNEYTDANESFNFRVYDSLNEVVIDQETASLPNEMTTAKLGRNYYELPTSSLSSGEVYTLEVENLKGEKKYLKFQN